MKTSKKAALLASRSPTHGPSLSHCVSLLSFNCWRGIQGGHADCEPLESIPHILQLLFKTDSVPSEIEWQYRCQS